ncbi:phosphohydrolase [Lentilactobacillus fungorum]|uniref:Phosphohydrolase n=1 Tax=Lentilactobacillus fungorum TaxID=2201250 RepID=A0ABQ3VYG0_9LACO|nr:HAD-IA family hydrolase [Lentilactobacillus fungorum]GHP12714.1 phosphohydrolase [Lentilactobacillus fungorum]
MINQLFWDFDGTLFNTYPKMVQAFKQALTDLNIDEVEIDEHDIYLTMRQHDVGTAIRKSAAFYGINEASLRRLNKKHQTKLVAAAQPFADVNEVLKLAKQLGGDNYLLTHRDDQAKALLEQFKLTQYFSDYVTSDLNLPRKPDPKSINYLIQKHHVDRKAAMMIGDRKLDIAAGHNANIAACLFDPDGIIGDSGNPDIRITAMADLISWLTKH